MFKEKGPFEGLLSPELIVLTSKLGAQVLYRMNGFIFTAADDVFFFCHTLTSPVVYKAAIDHALVISPI